MHFGRVLQFQLGGEGTREVPQDLVVRAAEQLDARRLAAVDHPLEVVQRALTVRRHGADGVVLLVWANRDRRSNRRDEERFGLEYTAADGTRQRPVLIHRALFGSIERFFGILTEHYAGAFPAWLALGTNPAT